MRTDASSARFGISRDITERRRMQDALALRTRQLEQKNEQIAEELRMASELQMAMLPHEFPSFLNNGRAAGEERAGIFQLLSFRRVRVSAIFSPSRRCLTRGGVFICDVMGHDVRAALVTAMMRSAGAGPERHDA